MTLASTSIAATAKALEAYPENFGAHTTLVPVDACNDLIAAIRARQASCVSHEAHRYAGQLVGFYPAREVVDAKTYIAGMTALLAAYPEDFVKRVCDPVVGVPSQSKWLPTLAEVKTALETEKSRRDNIEARARWTVIESNRRQREAEEEAKYKPGTEADRKAAVEQALKSLKTMTDKDWKSETSPQPQRRSA